MKLESEEIFQSGLSYTKELQITLDDDFNVPDSKPDIESVVTCPLSIHRNYHGIRRGCFWSQLHLS